MPDEPGIDDVAEQELSALTSEIIEAWRLRLRRLPDQCPRSGDRGESERLLVAALLRASFASGDDKLPALAVAAARYGATEGRDRLDPGGLCDELSLLRQIVWKHLRERDRSIGSAVDRILRFDRALSIVTKAAVRASYSIDSRHENPTCSDEEGASIESRQTGGSV